MAHRLKSLEEEFGSYLEHCYPGQSIAPEQMGQIRQAFFSGAMVVLMGLDAAGRSDIPEETAAAWMESLIGEVMADAKARLNEAAIKAKQNGQ